MKTKFKNVMILSIIVVCGVCGVGFCALGAYLMINAQSGNSSANITHIGGSNGSVTVVSNINWGNVAYIILGAFLIILAIVGKFMFLKDLSGEIEVDDSMVKIKSNTGERTIKIEDIENTKAYSGMISLKNGGRTSYFFSTENSEEIVKYINDRKNAIIGNNSSTKENDERDGANPNYIAELKELNNLLKEGVISQEEFDKKKKELLNK